jgi:hypothetical protein
MKFIRLIELYYEASREVWVSTDAIIAMGNYGASQTERKGRRLESTFIELSNGQRIEVEETPEEIARLVGQVEG